MVSVSNAGQLSQISESRLIVPNRSIAGIRLSESRRRVETAFGRGKLSHERRRAMRRNDPALMRHFELYQRLRGMTHSLPVRFTAHYDRNQRSLLIAHFYLLLCPNISAISDINGSEKYETNEICIPFFSQPDLYYCRSTM